MVPDQPAIPKYDDLMWPTLQALKALGGSGTVQEIEAQVYESEGYTDEQRGVLHRGGPITEIAYRLAWARTYLKRVGAIENSQRGVWSITDRGRSLVAKDMAKIPPDVRARARSGDGRDGQRKLAFEPREDEPSVDTLDGDLNHQWKEELLQVLLNLEPGAFERLAQRLLREQGFVNVKVTGRTGDGGIDGTGTLRMKLLSFPMFFQCKRYRGSVGASAVRDFRGAMVGRSDKGVLITTGQFTPDAIREANRDGAPPIDLVDGEQLCLMLKELGMGVKAELVERVTVDADWFRSL